MTEQQQEEPTLDTGSLESSLNDLLKATKATSLVKGGIENSGTYSDGKPSGGGQGSMSDAGGVDDLMIAKLTAAGLSGSQIAAFQAFMSSQDDEDEDEDEMDGMMSNPDMPPFTRKSKGSKPLQKSMDSFREDHDIQEAIDVSPFLEALVSKTSEQIDSMTKSHSRFAAEQAKVNRVSAAALYQIGTLIKSQAAVIDELSKRLGLVERAPVSQPKGVTRSVATPMQKSLPNEVGMGAPANEQLTKSEVLSTLSYMNLQKGMSTINGRRTSEIIGLYEGGGILDGETLQSVQLFLKQNPNEAPLARRYS